jgi:hypothetical protein
LSKSPRRRSVVLLAVGGAVLLSLLLGLYVGWRHERDPVLQADSSMPAEPLKLRLDRNLGSQKP